jgi:hypothetical protein
MKTTIKIHQGWFDAFDAIWAAVWANMFPDEADPDVPDMVEVTEDGGSIEIKKRWMGMGGGDSD